MSMTSDIPLVGLAFLLIAVFMGIIASVRYIIWGVPADSVEEEDWQCLEWKNETSNDNFCKRYYERFGAYAILMEEPPYDCQVSCIREGLNCKEKGYSCLATFHSEYGSEYAVETVNSTHRFAKDCRLKGVEADVGDLSCITNYYCKKSVCERERMI